MSQGNNFQLQRKPRSSYGRNNREQRLKHGPHGRKAPVDISKTGPVTMRFTSAKSQPFQ
jgi:hypothetical protein